MNNDFKKKIFAGNNREWSYAVEREPKNRILYILGCSWWTNQDLGRLLEKDYAEYFIVNKSIDGLSNTNMISILKNDLEFFKTIKNPFIPIKFIVNFSELGRNKKEFWLVNPKDYDNSIDFFRATLELQYQEVKELLKDHESYITTSFVPNHFNNNKRLLDFCQPTKEPYKLDGYSYSVGTYQFFDDNHKVFKFDKFKEEQILENSRRCLFNHKHVNSTLHPTGVEPYSRFFEYIRV